MLFSLREVIAAIQSYGKAHQFILQHGRWQWTLIPGVIFCVLFVLGIYFIWGYSTDFVNYLLNILPVLNWVQDVESGWVSLLFLLLSFSLHCLFLLLYLSYFRNLFLMVAAPVFAYISEKTAATLHRKQADVSFAALKHDTLRSIRLCGRNVLYQTGGMLLLVVAAFMPVVGLLSPLVAFFMECYFFGFSMLDYSCDRHQLGLPATIDFVKQHRGVAVGNGLIFYLFLFVPILGWMLAPAYAVIAGTLNLQYKRLL
ncbi:MAG TPA: EI24 domain-containing protein [Chitinophaga sp.]